MTTRVGVVHPGKMGVSVAAALLRGGHRVYWASEGRSEATRQRAASVGLEDVGTLARLCTTCELLVSVCPPAAAEAVATEVRGLGFRALYVDANAISPARACRIGEAMVAGGATFVDGGIVGGPAWEPGQTWLYLSGERAAEVAALFAAGPLETEVLGTEWGQASALKMCYAAYTKGRTALLSMILAAAEALEVREPLSVQWERDWPGFAAESEQRARRVTAKAWRFAGEMEEIAATFEQVGLPGDFHHAAATLYERLARFKEEPEPPPLADVLAALRIPPP